MPRAVQLRSHLHEHHEGPERIECIKHAAPRKIAAVTTAAVTAIIAAAAVTTAKPRVAQPERALCRGGNQQQLSLIHI